VTGRSTAAAAAVVAGPGGPPPRRRRPCRRGPTVRVPRHLQAPAALGPEPVREAPGGGGVDPHQPEPRAARLARPRRGGAAPRPGPAGRPRERGRAGPARACRRAGAACAPSPASVVPARRPADPGSLDRLAVEDRGARLGEAAFHEADPLAQVVVVLSAQRAADPPAPELRVAGSPRRVLPEKQPPRAAGAEQVEDRVRREAPRSPRRPAPAVALLQQGLEERPFLIGQVGRVHTPRRRDGETVGYVSAGLPRLFRHGIRGGLDPSETGRPARDPQAPLTSRRAGSGVAAPPSRRGRGGRGGEPHAAAFLRPPVHRCCAGAASATGSGWGTGSGRATSLRPRPFSLASASGARRRRAPPSGSRSADPRIAPARARHHPSEPTRQSSGRAGDTPVVARVDPPARGPVGHRPPHGWCARSARGHALPRARHVTLRPVRAGPPGRGRILHELVDLGRRAAVHDERLERVEVVRRVQARRWTAAGSPRPGGR
jgi:hypothetical protein